MVSLLIAIVSGFALSGAFAPIGLWFLLPFSIALLLYAITKTRRPFLVAFVFAALFNFLTLNWSGIYVGIYPVLFLIILQSVFYLPLGFISFKRNRYSRIWLVLPILLTADQLRSNFPFGGFGWNRLAFSQADSPYAQSAALFGDTALAFLGISLGIAIYLLCARAQLFSVAILCLVTTVMILLPHSSLKQGSAYVLAIQGNVPKLGLDFNSRAQEVFEYHLKETAIALQQIKDKPDFILWPENSVDVDPFNNISVGEKISQLAEQASTSIVVGAVLDTSSGPKNASIMWNSQGDVVSTYIKRSLTPFGEYIPFRKLAELISPLAKNVKDFVNGEEIIQHKTSQSIIAPIICYEVIDDEVVRSSSVNSNVIVVQTNNATFADSGQSRQQLNITRIRAIENNRWIVSVSTTGVSAIIDNFGAIQQITKQNTASFLSGDVVLITERSLASKLGGWSDAVLLIVAWLLYLGKRRKHAK